MSAPPAAGLFRDHRSLRRLVWRTLPVASVLAALLVALFLVSGVQQESADGAASVLDRSYAWVLVLSVLALLVLFSTIGYRLLQLARKVRSAEPGALLSARWVRNFLVLSLPPACIVYIFSAWFLTSTIDRWFDVEVERALGDSLALGQEFLDTRTLEVRNQMRETASGLRDTLDDVEQLRQDLLAEVRSSGPLELSVIDPGGTTIATASINPLTSLPQRPPAFALLQATERGEYAAAEPTGDGALQIRVMVSMETPYPGNESRILQAIYPLPPDITDLTRSIEQEYHRYQNVSYLRASLKNSFLLILSLVLLLTVLIAILVALNAARRMVTPLSRLSRATREVAAGDFGSRVETAGRDEIGFLVQSFNEMTQALRLASDSAEESRAALQAQGDYLETVLGNLSSGVLTLDAAERVVRANSACRQILGLPADLATGTEQAIDLQMLADTLPGVQPFVEAIRHQGRRGTVTWQQETRIQRGGTPLVLLARGSRLQALAAERGERAHGQVIVFDDVTVLNQAQREAAWAEAARRLAHEVKNPLTPIRLAAERLRMKLAGKLEPADRTMLERASDTIVAQVEALRALVDAFGDYAREPVLRQDEVQIDRLVREVVALYEQGDAATRFELLLQPCPGGLAADSGRLRQLLHNLIRNSREAAGEAPLSITITSRLREFEGRDWLQLELRDDGPGFPAAVLEHPFEPYATNKPGGSGLGLPICRKIVAEHDGRITLENPPGGGALVTILLPLDKS